MLRVSRSIRAYHHGNLGPALEDAALELLGSRGHVALSLREVARQAEVSHNAPYHHFGDRTSLLKRLSERCMAELLETMKAAVSEVDPEEAPHVAALAGGLAYIGYAAEYPERFRVVYDPDVCVPGSPTETMAPLIEEMEQLLVDAVAPLAHDAGAEQVAALTTAAWGSVHGLAELIVAGHVQLDEARPALMALFVRG